MPRKKQANYQIVASNGNGEIKLVLKDNIIILNSHRTYAMQSGTNDKNQYRQE
jgi:hypothetical protein